MIKLKHSGLYFGILAALAAMLLLSMGGGVWGAERSIGHWTGGLFQQVCHQNPERSFLFSGVPMAVNSRCFGIFAGMLAGWLLIPVLAGTSFSNKWILWLLALAVFVQIIDYTGNLFNLWENTNMSRAILGCLLGLPATMSVFKNFKPERRKINNHG